MDTDVFVYDDDCGFCTWWAEFIAERTDLEMVGFSDISDEHLDRLPENYESCAHMLTADRVYSCGAAIERALVRADLPPGSRDIFEFLDQFDDYRRFRERLYRAVAERRDLFGQFLHRSSPVGTDEE
ncbi:MAG: DCC1-like thiol-disulfide oxidoreductase family protein [Natronomonas sp.]